MASRNYLPFVNSREAEIIEVVARNGWDYFRNQLSLDRKPQKFSLPLPGVLRQILIELGPTFVKLGQLLSTRPDLLDPEYIEALETLQTDVPALPWREVEVVLKSELQQPWNSVFAEIETVAIAAGSLGQVHRGKLLNGQIVAIKIQRPGIRQVIEQDLQVLQSLAQWFSGDSLGQAYDLPGLVEEFRISIMGELDFRREARNTEQLGDTLSQSTLWQPRQVVVPQVYLSHERLLVLEWIQGKKLSEVDLPEPRRKALAALIVQVIMQQMFLNNFFHADPHPGNFLYLGDEKEDRIALLDFGMVAMLDPRTQRIITDLLVGIVYQQPRQVAQAIRELGFTRLEIDLRAIETAFDRLLRRFYTRPLEEINMAELLNEALRIPRENQIQMPGTIGLFVKAVANVEGIARRLDPVFPFVDVARPVVEKSLQQRMFGPQVFPEVARSSLYLSQFLIDFPQRLEVLVDRLERSELGLNWRWRDQSEFQKTSSLGMRRLSLAILGVGSMLSGSLLLASGSNASSNLYPGFTLLWSQGLLTSGVVLSVWLVLEFIFKP
ncbi:MAG: AarF/ABC1/UbiB kinase family protein [Scytonema sp. PMC 1069.18]|nr:AarF/ABC1/UbiB kinase family protein [Scytonema sp. PMC 1069.18]MEC4882608.1 AarF/ABC1/UbiB kinase family protein [Scytonema sp. PMC 1070.18]